MPNRYLVFCYFRLLCFRGSGVFYLNVGPLPYAQPHYLFSSYAPNVFNPPTTANYRLSPEPNPHFFINSLPQPATTFSLNPHSIRSCCRSGTTQYYVLCRMLRLFTVEVPVVSLSLLNASSTATILALSTYPYDVYPLTKHASQYVLIVRFNPAPQPPDYQRSILIFHVRLCPLRSKERYKSHPSTTVEAPLSCRSAARNGQSGNLLCLNSIL